MAELCAVSDLVSLTSGRMLLATGAAGVIAGPLLAATDVFGGAIDMPDTSYGNGTLPQGVRSRMISGINGLDVHVLETGHESPGRPLALLLHGFPDLALGWRRVMPILADAGYHVVAPDQRGYGRTTGWANGYDTPLAPFSLLNMTRDAIALVTALGYRHVSLLVGHDFGSPVASYCAVSRPDVFQSVVLMSAPFPGPPRLAFDTANGGASPAKAEDASKKLAAGLAALDPPRVLYQQYLGSREANEPMWHPPQGLHAFLRAFFHVKSADWQGNRPHPVAVTAAAIAEMPTYYVMERGKTMPETVAPFHPSAEEVRACKWLSEEELAVYVEEYSRTGFQGALQMYRVLADPALTAELRLFSGRTIDIPSLFVGGASDWGPYATPGALETMQTKAMTELRAVEMIDGAGHWIQQEQPERLGALLVKFGKDARLAG